MGNGPLMMTTSANSSTENRKPKTENCTSSPYEAPRPQLARPLVWVTISFILGVAAPSWGLKIPPGWVAAGAAGLWLLLALAWRTRRRAAWLPLALFFLLGAAFYQQAQQPLFPAQHLTRLPLEQDLTLRGKLYRPAKIGAHSVQLFLEAEACREPGGWSPVSGKLLVTAPALPPPPVGAAVVLKARLRAPRTPKNPGSFDQARYLAADGIFRAAHLRQPEDLIILANAGASPLRERLRGSIRVLLQELPAAPRAMYLAMLLGDQGEITLQMRQAFSRTGTSHLLVINGMHLGAVAMVTYFLCFWGLGRFPRLLLRVNAVKVSTLISALPVAAYAWMAGGSPSTQRAEVMVLACLMLLFLGRPREVWSALALAALIILGLSPLRLYSISFQLSFAAVAALIYFLPRWFQGARERFSHQGWKEKLPARVRLWLKEAAAASLVATLATAPLVAVYFQTVSLLGAAVNLAAIPLVLFLALPLGEAAVLSQTLHLTPVAQGLLGLGQVPLWLGYEAIAGTARLPGSAFTVSTPTWVQIAAYFLLWIFLFPPRRQWWTWLAAGLAGLVLVGTMTLPPIPAPKDLEVTCLDSGGGLAGLAVAPEGERLVFSAPGPSWPGRTSSGPGILPGYLHWRQCRRLDQVMALGLAQRNAPELLALARRFTVGQFWFGHRGPEGPAYYELMNLLGDEGRFPRSLGRGRPPGNLGSVGLEYPPVGEDKGTALQLSYQGRLVLVIPPGVRLKAGELAVSPGSRVAALIIPGRSACDLAALSAVFQPEIVTIYAASGKDLDAPVRAGGSRCLFTAEGAVSLRISALGAVASQWRP
ncbi:MAG: ComEC/Rec2 family competence protein [Deltaproteobacteria bacterium]|nr:MAG: ComEC/Rec2 family competence protein [Deltaproteobacteria bacterium]